MKKPEKKSYIPIIQRFSELVILSREILFGVNTGDFFKRKTQKEERSKYSKLNDEQKKEYILKPVNYFYSFKLLSIFWAQFILEFLAFIGFVIISFFSLKKIVYYSWTSLSPSNNDFDISYFISKIISYVELLFLAPLAYLIINGFLRIIFARYPNVFSKEAIDPNKFKAKYFFISSLLGVIATSMVKIIIGTPLNFLTWKSFFFCAGFPIIAHIIVFFVILKFYKILSNH